MGDSLFTRFLGLAMAGLLSLAFAMGTMNTRPPELIDPELVTLMLAGFSPHDFCLSGGEDSHEHDPSCALCLSFAPPALPPVCAAETEARYVSLVVLPQVRKAAFHRQDPATPLRGPPLTGATA